MLFSSIIFLIVFLPVVLFFNTITPKLLKNSFLLLFSLLFYAWGEGAYVFLMLISIVINYSIGLLIEKYKENKLGKIFLTLGIIINIGLIVYFKYANFIYDNIHQLISSGNESQPLYIHLPIGISFFTFQSISYLIDVYRKETVAQKNPINIGLYIALFPQLIAGPIVRYTDIVKELAERKIDIGLFSSGVTRFVIGLSKKVLIANSVGAVADQVFQLPINELSTSVAWLGIICYSLQIYFDFSGYSDMAIGLGRMLGFKFLENFNFPYIAKSIQDFWRRWHISLSSWFKDYLYIPLGGSKNGIFRTYANLIIVFFITGLWHGASWNFIFWGLLHGAFLIIERIGFNKILLKLWSPLAHIYTLLVVVIAWVFFRIEDIDTAFLYVFKMFGYQNIISNEFSLTYFTNSFNLLMIIIGIITSTKVLHFIPNYFNKNANSIIKFGYQFIQIILLLALLTSCISELASGTYNPFIYYRF